MYNSLEDPNISLACNFLDSVRLLDERTRTSKVKTTGFGPDVNNETFPQLFSMACYFVNALRGEGMRGVYKSLPFAYYYRLRQSEKLPKHWLTVRMLSLLPRFAEGKKKRLGADLIPPFMFKVGPRNLAFGEFNGRGGHTTHSGVPLSFVPEIDSYWLGDEYIDVFGFLGPSLKEMLIPMSYPEYEEDKPFEADSEAALMGTVKNHLKEKNWLNVATLFFALFCPDRLRQVVDPSHEYGIPYTSDGLLRLLGDTMQFAPEKVCSLFLIGMNAIYLALGKCGVDISGRSADVLDRKGPET